MQCNENGIAGARRHHAAAPAAQRRKRLFTFAKILRPHLRRTPAFIGFLFSLPHESSRFPIGKHASIACAARSHEGPPAGARSKWSAKPAQTTGGTTSCESGCCCSCALLSRALQIGRAHV